MKILQINTIDIGGGAEKVAMNLHRAYRSLGHRGWLAVGFKKGMDATVVDISRIGLYSTQNSSLFKLRDWLRARNQTIPGMWRLGELVDWSAQPGKHWDGFWGIEDFRYPGSDQLLNSITDFPDIIHAHNLHGGYFDLRNVPKFSQKIPWVITLHDEWMLTGHCAYTLGCNRWRSGCGACPHLDIYPALKRDNTRSNWERKKSIFLKSHLTLVVPSIWLAQRVKESLLSHLPVKIITNGIDLEVFKPGSQLAAREALQLEEDSFIILYTAAGGRNSPFKDYEMLDRVIARLQKQAFNKAVILIALGGGQSRNVIVNGVRMIEKPYLKDPYEVSQHYQACDLYIHTAKADNSPLVILEAMACGKAIVATNAGGIPELVREDETGYTVPIGNDEAMVERIILLRNDPDRLRQMGENAGKIAKKEYGLERMVSDYLHLYQELIDKRRRQNAG